MASSQSTIGDNAVWKTVKPYFNGGLSGMLATCIIQPIDMVKVRLQLGATGGPLGVASQMIKQEGVGSLYKGLSAGLLRQATYTTSRLGIYQQISKEVRDRQGGAQLTLGQSFLCGLTAGGIGALVGNPADLCLLRMQADGTLPPEQRRNYKGVGDAFVRIVREEGVMGLFRGAGPTVIRAMALNAGMFASQDRVKTALQEMGFDRTSYTTVFGSAFVAGFFASACSLPFDFVKTRLQKMTPDATGKMPYKGFVDCFMQTLRKEGPLKFYTGFPTFCIRIAPHVVFTLVFMDMLPHLEKRIGL